VSGSISFDKSKDGDLLVHPDDGTSFLISGKYGGKLSVAAVAFQVKPEGHDGPYDLVVGVVEASFQYDEAIISNGAVSVNGRRYYQPESFTCSHTEKGERWITTMHVDRDCSSPVNQSSMSN
jgi:hypothetical protein